MTDTQTDYWAPIRVRLRVFLEELEAIVEGDACPRPGCPSMVDVRAAINTLDAYIDAMPVDCECA